jgi:hypothetical protein
MDGAICQSGAPSNDVASDPEKARNSKRAGELAEAAFLHRAVGLGFRVTKPFGDKVCAAMVHERES